MQAEWIRRPQAETSVAFVHGILSSGEACWRHTNGSYWPELLKEEPEFGSLGIYVFTYQTGVFSGSYRLGDIVDALKEHMRLDGVLENRRLIFVCHSMGGIVVRKFIVERAIELMEGEKEISLFLVASPSLGSDYADWLSPLAQLFGHSQADALRFVRDNNWLNDLDKEFNNLKEGGRPRIKGKELVEDKFVYLKKLWRRQVVEPFSGARYFGEPFKVPGSDHFSIAKPENKGAIQHRLLCQFLRDTLEASTRPSSRSRSDEASVLASPSPEPIRAAVATSTTPQRDVVRFEIRAGFAFAEGFDGLWAKVNEVLENLAEKSIPAFAVECPWLDELESQIDAIKRTPLPDRDEKELRALTKLRGEVRQKVNRVRWAFEILFTSPELREAIAEVRHYLNDKGYAQCITGIMEIENYSALRLGSDHWFLFYRGGQARSCTLFLSDRDMESMERGYYENDYLSPRRRSGLRTDRVYAISYFAPSVFFGRVVPQILCFLSEQPEELRRSPQLSALLKLSDWKFSKSPEPDLPELKA